MKFSTSIIALAGCAIFATSCKHADSAPKDASATQTESNAPAKMETASFSIDGMSCSIGCAKTLEKKLSALEGVEKASVDFDKKSATVEFDANKQTPETLAKTVESAADGKTYKVSNLHASGNHAALLDQEKEKETKKAGKEAKSGTKSKDAKPACCSAKKHCSADEKKA